MATEVVSVCNRVPGPAEPYYRYKTYIDSLLKFDCQPTILGLGEHWGGLMSKPRILRQWLRDGQNTSGTIIVADAWDVLFAAHPDDVYAGFQACIKDYGLTEECILFNAEKGLFPRGDLEHAFPPVGSAWRYLNSGLMIGDAASILKLLEGMQLDDIHEDYQRPDQSWVHPNDQGWYQVAYAAKLVPMALDTDCKIFQAFSACREDEFDLSEVPVKNIATGSSPLVYHFNGGSKNDIAPIVISAMGLS